MRSTRLAVALAGVLALGTAATSVAAPAAKHRAAAPVAKPTCWLALAEQIPSGDTAINPADTQGSNQGTVTCGKLLGRGLAFMSFTVPDSGNLVGNFKQYFATGNMHGTYVLVPDNNDSSNTDQFSASSFTGTMKVAGGTGAFALAKGTGTLKCSSPDSVHYHCIEHLKLSSL